MLSVSIIWGTPVGWWISAVRFDAVAFPHVRNLIAPDYASGSHSTVVMIPLWLLAAICLAWPVTSLLLARRRRKGRGFAVEPAPDAAPPAIDPPHHPSNLPPP